jgi:hypothetical protein
MHIAMVITLLFASATSALGVPRAMMQYRIRLYGHLSHWPVFTSCLMTAWFGFAALWLLWHS